MQMKAVTFNSMRYRKLSVCFVGD